MNRDKSAEAGFTMIEVACAALISMIGLMFLATLFTLSMSQNKMNKQFSATTALAQEKIEELNAVDYSFIATGGDLFNPTTVGTEEYFDEIFVDDSSGQVYVGADIPAGQVPNYRRYWMVEPDTQLVNTFILSARVVASQSGHNRSTPEETTLSTVRSY